MEESQGALMLAALGHEARLSVFRRLIAAGPEGVAAGALSAALDMPPSSLSHHLSALDHAGLIAARRDGRHLFYSVVAPHVAALIGFLRDDCCGGRPELCGFAPAGERTTC
jgi:ArsR family transcriptional regulator, arsenate/arsenite/antimonite-responsive transcriptional repressor